MIGGPGSSLTYTGDITNNYGVGQYASIDALKGATAPAGGTIVSVSGYYAAGDGGGGQFYYDDDAEDDDNGGTIIEPTAGVGRWLRIYTGAVNVKWFGARAGNISYAAANTTALIAAGAAGNIVFDTAETYYVSPGTLIKGIETLRGGVTRPLYISAVRRFVTGNGGCRVEASDGTEVLKFTEPTAARRGFPVLYQFASTNSPVADAAGLKYSRLGNASRFGVSDATPATETDLNNAATAYSNDGGRSPEQWTIFDIEAWPNWLTTTLEDYTEARDNIAAIFRGMRSRLTPGRKFGNYNYPVYRDQVSTLLALDSAEYLAFQARTDFQKVTADLADIFVPSLYTLAGMSEEDWTTFATRTISECRRAARYGQKVMPMLWCQYYTGGTYLSKDYMRLQLDTCLEYADAVFIFNNTGTFADTDPWFVAILEFMASCEADGISINDDVW